MCWVGCNKGLTDKEVGLYLNFIANHPHTTQLVTASILIDCILLVDIQIMFYPLVSYCYNNFAVTTIK